MKSPEQTAIEPDSPAAIAKEFFLNHSNAALATHSLAVPGYPFGSVVPYDVSPRGEAVIFISNISQHYKNLLADPRSSLLIVDPKGESDPQAHGRLTLLADFLPVNEAEEDKVREAYFRRFPHSPARSLVHSFSFFLGRLKRVRWIAGFGDIRWIEAEDFIREPLDPVAYRAEEILEHMNLDHKDALSAYARSFAGLEASPEQCRMTRVNRLGFKLSIRRDSSEEFCDIRFPEPATDSAEVRRILIEMLRACS